MKATLITFRYEQLALMVHRALGRPTTGLIAFVKTCAWLTVALISLSHGPRAAVAGRGLLPPLLPGGPSG